MKPWERSFYQLPSNRTKTAWTKKKKEIHAPIPLGEKIHSHFGTNEKWCLAVPLGWFHKIMNLLRLTSKKKKSMAPPIFHHTSPSTSWSGLEKTGFVLGLSGRLLPPQTSSSMSSSCDISLSLPVSRWFFVTRRFPVFPRMVTRWGPLTTISGFITSYTRLQPCLKKVCWGCNYLI